MFQSHFLAVILPIGMSLREDQTSGRTEWCQQRQEQNTLLMKSHRGFHAATRGSHITPQEATCAAHQQVEHTWLRGLVNEKEGINPSSEVVCRRTYECSGSFIVIFQAAMFSGVNVARDCEV